jgi:DNA-binding response OmpR family regulator
MGARIVLTDDEPDMRAIYAEVLRRDGFQVWEAADGAEAIALVEAQKPDLLLLDVWMPILNGFEVLDRLCYDPVSTTMKVVMLSNLYDSDTRLQLYSEGAADYWVKGLPLDEFRAKVRRLLEAEAVAGEAT